MSTVIVSMKTVTQRFVKHEDKKHSVIFCPAVEQSPTHPVIATSIYISRAMLPPLCTEVVLTLNVPDFPMVSDQTYTQLKTQTGV